MSVDPISGAKLASATVSTLSAAADTATNPNGTISKLLGLNVIQNDIRLLHKELDKFVATVEEHHVRHGESTQAIGLLAIEIRNIKEHVSHQISSLERSVSNHLETADRLADERARAQERALREFEARLNLLCQQIKN